MSLRLFAPTFALLATCAAAQPAFPPPPRTAPTFRKAYDASREKTLTGTVKSVSVDPQSPIKLITLELEAEGGTWRVVAGTQALATRHNFQFVEGDTLTTVGVPVGDSTSTLLLARTITKGAETLTLLDATGMPVDGPAGPPVPLIARNFEPTP
jgi:hypothetical protein